MDVKVKTLLIISFSALFVASCSSTNGGMTFGQQVNTGANQQTGKPKGVTHSHGGIVHTHPLPEGGLAHTHNFNAGSGTATTTRTCTPCNAGTNRNVVNVPATNPAPTQGTGGNCHMHNGRRHCHPLPASGTNHTHNQSQGQPQSQPQTQASTATQGQSNSTYYDYSGGSATGSSYYNYGGSKGNGASRGVAHSHNGKTHTHLLPASGLNHTHDGGSTAISNTYSTYANGGSVSTTPAPASNGNVYIVKPKDTVFQVMRNTGVYWKTIIKLNNLQAPDYTIVPGQRLRLK